MNDQLPLLSEFDAAPYSRKSKTSTEAAERMTRSGKHRTIKERVMDYLRLFPLGVTDEGIAATVMLATGCRYTSVVAARNSLCEQGLVEDSGKVRRSPSTGMPCTVWVLA